MEYEVYLTLIPAPDDYGDHEGFHPLTYGRYEEYVSGIRRLTDLWQSGGVESRHASRLGQGGMSLEPIGDLVIKCSAVIGPIVGTAIGAWLQARNGRKVRVKVGDIEVEAQSREGVEKLLARVQEIQRSNEPKRIHEP